MNKNKLYIDEFGSLRDREDHHQLITDYSSCSLLDIIEAVLWELNNLRWEIKDLTDD